VQFSFWFLGAGSSQKRDRIQGTLAEGEGSVQFTSSLRGCFVKEEKYCFFLKNSQFELVSTRRSTVLILSLRQGFPAGTIMKVAAAFVAHPL